MGKSRRKRGWAQAPIALPSPVIDNHTHLPLHEGEIPNPEGVRVPRERQGQLAKQVNVAGMITSGCELPELEPTLDQLGQNQWAALAIHPNEAALHAGFVEKSPDGLTHERQAHHQVSLEEAIARVGQLCRDRRVVAVGETGLDYYRTSEAGKQYQLESFRAHIELAKELDLPLQIHDREAHSDTIETLLDMGAPARTVFHCYSGDEEMARVLAENGWYASFSGTLTYPANEHLRRALLALPRELVLVETDAPYLTAQAHRGQPNASYLMPFTVRRIAALWAIADGVGPTQDDDALGKAMEKSEQVLADELAQTCRQLLANTVQVYSVSLG
ncbi:deoxyribonuclease [Actinomyces sp. HMSC072A03]|nr:deoxyribonuclease [Actinomyces sp. HMSC072A03]